MVVSLPRRVEDHTYILLDVLRYLACVSVFVGHFLFIFVVRLYGLAATYYNPHMLIAAAYFIPHALAVMVFFVLSGFLIGYKALVEIQSTQRFDLRDYLKKRILRIFPPLYFGLLLAVLVYVLIKSFHLFGERTFYLNGDLYMIAERAHVSGLMILKCLFLVPGDTGIGLNGPLWSLSYEFYYYLLFALILTLWVNKNLRQALYLSLYVIALPLLCYCLHGPYGVMFAQVMILLLVWLFGVGIAYLYLQQQCLSWPLNMGLLSIALFLIYPFAVMAMPFVKIWGDTFLELSGGIFAALLIMYLVNIRLAKPPAKILRLLARGSFYTYTLYIIHFPLLMLTFSLLGAHLLSFNAVDYVSLFVALFVVINVLSYYLAQVLENRLFWERCLKRIF